MVGMDVGFENPLFASIELSYEEVRCEFFGWNLEDFWLGMISKMWKELENFQKNHSSCFFYQMKTGEITYSTYSTVETGEMKCSAKKNPPGLDDLVCWDISNLRFSTLKNRPISWAVGDKTNLEFLRTFSSFNGNKRGQKRNKSHEQSIMVVPRAVPRAKQETYSLKKPWMSEKSWPWFPLLFLFSLSSSAFSWSKKEAGKSNSFSQFWWHHGATNQPYPKVDKDPHAEPPQKMLTFLGIGTVKQGMMNQPTEARLTKALGDIFREKR